MHATHCMFRTVLALTVLLALNLGLPLADVTELPPQAKQHRVIASYGQLPLYFIENKGQMDRRVKFYARGRGYTLFFTEEGLHLSSPKSQDASLEPSSIMLAPLGMKRGGEVVAEEPQAGKVNYFIGNDPQRWKTNIPTYRAVVYREAYPGIDLKFYGNSYELEYDVVVRPGGEPAHVTFEVSGGIAGLEITRQGDLAIRLQDGSVVEQRKPILYQEVDGQRVPVEGKFTIYSDVPPFVYGVEVSSYDPKYTLVIDPVLGFSTYLGGSERDGGSGIAVDSSGNVYVAGFTQSLDFPTENPLQGSLAGNTDAFVAKINATGDALVYSTYLGGSGQDGRSDIGPRIAVDTTGNVYLIGITQSLDFPTKNPLQGSLAGQLDAFVAKIDASGAALVYSTYLGGSQDDYGMDIAVDTLGNAYVTGWTGSSDFPTRNPFQKNLKGAEDAFVTKIDISGALVYSTYLGGQCGASMCSDRATGVAVDDAGNVYITGLTNAPDFPTKNPFQATLRGASDAFVTKLNATGDGLVYSTYLGGNGAGGGDEFGMGITVDSVGNAYVIGRTGAPDFPTENPLQGSLAGQLDAFVAKINATGDALVYSTYLGGSGYEVGRSIAVDGSGNAYVTGDTSSLDFPTLHPIQASLAGTSDAFVTKIVTPHLKPSEISLDSFYVTNGSARAIEQANGVVYLGGDFTEVGPLTGAGVAIEAATGVVNLAWPKVTGGAQTVNAVVPDGAGGWYIGGSFTQVGEAARNHIAHILANGSVDPVWVPNTDSPVYALAIAGNTVYAGGEFTSIGGQTRNRIAALSATTGTATPWNPNANGIVRTLVIAQNTIYVGGQFTVIGGQPRSRIAALDATAGNATLWAPDADSTVRTLAIGGTTVYAGGDFTVIGGAFRNRIAAIDANTQRATLWDPNADGSVLAILSTGGIVGAAGQFTTIGNRTRSRLAALDATTGTAVDWNPNADNTVRALLLSGTTLYAGGDFTRMAGQPRRAVAAFPIQDVPRLGLVANQALLHVSDTLALNAVAMPGSVPASVDVYIALLLPDATLLFWQGGLNFTRTIVPIVRNWMVGSFREEIFRYTFQGGEPSGNYTWLGAFTQPGTFNIIGDIIQAPFNFRP